MIIDRSISLWVNGDCRFGKKVFVISVMTVWTYGHEKVAWVKSSVISVLLSRIQLGQ